MNGRRQLIAIEHDEALANDGSIFDYGRTGYTRADADYDAVAQGERNHHEDYQL